MKSSTWNIGQLKELEYGRGEQFSLLENRLKFIANCKYQNEEFKMLMFPPTICILHFAIFIFQFNFAVFENAKLTQEV
jgi:hypothetical protein